MKKKCRNFNIVTIFTLFLIMDNFAKGIIGFSSCGLFAAIYRRKKKELILVKVLQFTEYTFYVNNT